MRQQIPSRWNRSRSEAVFAKRNIRPLLTFFSNPSFTRSGNKFVETTLKYVLTYLKSKGSTLTSSSKMTVMADDSYYSQSSTSRPGQDGFSDFGCKLSEAHKTGLGSSAALVTALTSALLTWYTPASQPQLSQQVIHNLAQAAHCAAQGKVGSGFDVAAAVFGSCLYRRFSPAILEDIGEPTSEGFATRLQVCIDNLDEAHQWDVEVASNAVQIPRSLLLLMCDVDCGSETPGMVRKILAWRKEKPSEAGLLWDNIQQGSKDLCQILTRLSKSEGNDEKEVQELDDTIQRIRSLVRDMSTKSNVPVEPQVITELLDFCTELPGVIGGVAPGAGGYDAVALLVQNDAEVVKELGNRLGSWKAQEESTGITIGKVQLLKARQAYGGVRFEEVERYTAWV